MASTMSLRGRLLFSDAAECLVWVGGDANNMNGVAAGSWTDGVYTIVRTSDWGEALLDVVREDLGSEDAFEEELLVAIREFLCFLVIAASCAGNWSSKIVLYVSDNQLVQRWLTNMRARSRIANFICGLVALLMSRSYSLLFGTEELAGPSGGGRGGGEHFSLRLGFRLRALS